MTIVDWHQIQHPASHVRFVWLHTGSRQTQMYRYVTYLLRHRVVGVRTKQGIIVWLLSPTTETKRMTEMVTTEPRGRNQPIDRMRQSQRKRRQVSIGKMQSRHAGWVHPNAYKYSSTPARLETPNTSTANEQSEATKHSLSREQKLVSSLPIHHSHQRRRRPRRSTSDRSREAHTGWCIRRRCRC
jgi:hypothetical protein